MVWCGSSGTPEAPSLDSLCPAEGAKVPLAVHEGVDHTARRTLGVDPARPKEPVLRQRSGRCGDDRLAGSHIAIIVSIYVIGRRPVPYGSSSFLYACIGILPYITWSYMSRFTMMGTLQNRNFMAYPIIRPLDMMIARLALESVSIFIITVGLVCIAEMIGVDAMPLNLSAAVLGLLSAVLLGVGFRVLNSVIVMMFPMWVLGYVGIIILFWITSGMAFNPEAMPAEIGYYLSWNPLLHSVEWIRSAYYADFPAHLLDKTYVVSFGAGTLALGLILERTMKRYFK